MKNLQKYIGFHSMQKIILSFLFCVFSLNIFCAVSKEPKFLRLRAAVDNLIERDLTQPLIPVLHVDQKDLLQKDKDRYLHLRAVTSYLIGQSLIYTVTSETPQQQTYGMIVMFLSGLGCYYSGVKYLEVNEKLIDILSKKYQSIFDKAILFCLVQFLPHYCKLQCLEQRQ